jgi:hypothetical protein
MIKMPAKAPKEDSLERDKVKGLEE